MDQRDKVTVILGAGASAGLHNEQGPSNSGLRPPLANELFVARPEFREHLLKYPGAHQLQQAELGAMSSKNTFPLEEKLREYAKDPNSDIRDQFKYIPPYFRDIIRRCASGYLAGSPGAYATFLHQLLRPAAHDVLFIVLNYDTILENALNIYYGNTFPMSQFQHYISGRASGRPMVVTMHGSTNWFQQLPDAEDWKAALAQFDPLSSPTHAIVWDPSEADGAQHSYALGGARWIYPIITAPLAGKDETQLVCPPDHLTEMVRFVRSCRKYVSIGTSGLDSDLLTLLDEHVPEHSRLHVVTLGDAATVTRRLTAAVAGFRWYLQPNQYDGGFIQYLDEGDLHWLLENPPE